MDSNLAIEKWERKVARLEKELSRRTPGGANWKKTKAKLNVARARLENARLFADSKKGDLDNGN